MRITINILVLIIVFYQNIISQNYNQYLNQGKGFFAKKDYLKALDRFDLAYEFANSNDEKAIIRSWKKKCRNVIQNRMDRYSQMQLDIETLTFDNVIKAKYDDWNGYENANESYKNEILSEIKDLDFASSYLYRIPRQVSECFNLESINLYNNRNIDWNDGFIKLERCIKLNELDISGNELKVIPEGVIRLKSLKKLYLNSNRIAKIYTKLETLINLEVLNIWQNELTEVPLCIFQLRNLTFLNIQDNQLLRLHSNIGQLVNLRELYLARNKLMRIPNEIGHLKSLEILDLRNNNINDIPSGIDGLINLRKILIGYNQIKSLPKEIGEISNLSRLYLDNNQLAVLPKEICNLTNLTILDLSYNQLSDLPDEMKNLRLLRQLELTGNKFSEQEKVKIKRLLPGCEISF